MVDKTSVSKIFIYVLLGLVALAALGALIWYGIYSPIKRRQRKKRLEQLGPELLEETPVDLSRYSGEWFEVARKPNSFQTDCLRSKATYSLSAQKFDQVVVLNQCSTKDGQTKPKKNVVGRARPLNPQNTALSVGFAPQWLGSAAEGDYWILDLDDEYRHAIVGSPDRKYLWFLAREPTVESSEFDRMIKVAQSKGYNTSDLIVPPEDAPLP